MAANGLEEMSADLFPDNLVGLSEGSLEGSLEPSESSVNKDTECKICDNKLCNPLILNCLHVFCETCLEKLLIGEVGDQLNFNRTLMCPTCKQETKVPGAGVSSLPSDYILTNTLDVSSPDQTIVCTCCKSKEQAIARCSDCSHFLCPNCTSAHEYMRCFENHRVVHFDALRDSNDTLVIHKPIFCELHSGESLAFFCHHCERAACQECVVRLHKSGPNHQCERLAEAEASLRRQLNNMARMSASRISECQRVTEKLDDSLTELQQQREEAQRVIRDTYQASKAVLQRARDNALTRLDHLHSERELKVMDLYNNTNNTVQKLEDAYKFTSRLLKKGDGTEIAMLKKVVAQQINYLLSETPKLDVKLSFEFETNSKKLEAIIAEGFGKFKTENGANETDDSGVVTGRASFDATPPAPMQSFDDFAIAPTSPLVATPLAPTFPPLQSMVEFNIHQLANLQTDVTPVHTSPVPMMPDFLDDINSTQVFNNLHALAKLELNAEVNGGMGRAVGAGPGRSPSMGTLPTTPSPRPGDEGALSTPAASPFSRPSKATAMHIRYKFGQLGSNRGQFNSPHGFCLGNEEDIIVADTNNHRITVFEKSGAYKFHFGTAGKEEGQLWYPRKVAIMRATGKFVVCDRGNERSRMQIFTKNGHFLKKIAVRYIDIVAGLAVTGEGNIVAVDSVTPTVFVISENGDLLSWFDCSDCMREPSDIAINGKEFYVCDFKGHCVVVFTQDGKFLRRIGSDPVTNYPNGIDVSDAGDVLIGDSHGNRFHVAVFSREGQLITEFECPYVKVSRCCGLKITSEGYIVTLAKNNHHVLVLNTLYIM